jgi:hypothetical protein
VATLHYGGESLPLTFTNHFLAHLQVATYQRFGEGRGFFLTGTCPDSGGTEVTFSQWVCPGVPLSFSYDVRDESGNHVPPIKLDHKEIGVILEAMNRPEGVRASEALWLPFADQV